MSTKIGKKVSSEKIFLVALLMLTFIKVLVFTLIPPGLNQDELSTAYESKSLLEHGTDRWGNEFPAYFPSWGSGQSVLLAIIQVPFIAILGLNNFSIRLPVVIMGALLPFLVYAVVKKNFNIHVAYLSGILAATLPAFIMPFRWSLDANILPFFITLALFFLTYALEGKKKYIYLALLTFALTTYAYITIILILPFFFILFVVFILIDRKEEKSNVSHPKDHKNDIPKSRDELQLSVFLQKIKLILNYKNYKFNPNISKLKFHWILACCIFVLVVLPILLTVLKNNFGVESIPNKLGFVSIPDISSSRYDEIGGLTLVGILKNLGALLIGYYDFLIWNSVPFFPGFTHIGGILLFIGLFIFMKNITSTKLTSKNDQSSITGPLDSNGTNLKNKNKFRNLSNQKFKNIVFFYFLSCIPAFILIPFNLNRHNFFHLPFLIFISYGVIYILKNIVGKTNRNLAIFGFVAYYTIFYLTFTGAYIRTYPSLDSTKQAFNVGLKNQIENVEGVNLQSELDYIYLTDEVSLNYIYYLYYKDIDSKEFRNSVVSGNEKYDVLSHGKYVFNKEYLVEQIFEKLLTQKDKKIKIGYILKGQDSIEELCKTTEIYEIETYQDSIWEYGYCVMTPDKFEDTYAQNKGLTH